MITRRKYDYIVCIFQNLPNVVLDYLGPPHISVERISPTSFAVSWSHKNPDIDAWTVSVAQISLEEDESEIPENITIPYEKVSHLSLRDQGLNRRSKNDFLV